MSAVRYRVKSKIADGGMAEIFLAQQIGAEGFEKPVVLKRILPAFAKDPSFVRMFLDEAHIASTLSHSNIVQILDLGKAEGQFFLALELVDGFSLEQVRKRAKAARLKMPIGVALYVVGCLCRALAFAHARTVHGKPMGLVHRDVSPQNVLLSREGEVKLTDFGIARAAGRREKSMTGVIKGKISYMSPEQASGEDLDGRSDVFSAGTVLYLLTVGQKPFEGANDVEVLLGIRKGRYPKPSSIVRGFNADVERLIARALRVDRDKRWPSAEKMADRIDTIGSKLGQPTGPSALKKWLHALSEKDGVPPITEAEPAPETRATIELGSADIKLQEVTPPREDRPTREERVREERPTRAETHRSERMAKPPPEPLARSRAKGASPWRWALVLLLVAVLGTAVWFGLEVLPQLTR